MDSQELRGLSNEGLVQAFENVVTKNAMPLPEQVDESLRELGPNNAKKIREEILRRLRAK